MAVCNVSGVFLPEQKPPLLAGFLGLARFFFADAVREWPGKNRQEARRLNGRRMSREGARVVSEGNNLLQVEAFTLALLDRISSSRPSILRSRKAG